jgi:hypothetical protein
MELNWNISNLQSYTDYQGYSDVVFKVFWNLTASETVNNKTYTVSNNDITVLTLGELQPFTPFNELTKDQVVNWITSSINYPALTAAMYENLQQQINPTVVDLPPPWN